MIHEAEDLSQFHVALKFETVDAGGTAVFRARLAANLIDDPSPVEVLVTDDAGTELWRGGFEDAEDGWHRTPLIRLRMPAEPGDHAYHAHLQDMVNTDDLAEDDEPPEPEIYATDDFIISATGHSVQAVVWDVPGAIEAGSRFSIKVGLRCSCGCDPTGWEFAVIDSSGKEIAAGVAGNEAWQGTTGLHHTVVELTAPVSVGATDWIIRASEPQEPVAHAGRDVPFNIRTMQPAQHEIRVTVYDAETGQPVPRAKVVAHPYRTQTDETGKAVLKVAPGAYTIFASGLKYFALKQERQVDDDIDLRADLHRDREYTVEDMWS